MHPWLVIGDLNFHLHDISEASNFSTEDMYVQDKRNICGLMDIGYTAITNKVNDWFNIKEDFYKQQSGDTFITEMDHNTKYFHTLANRRMFMKNIDCLCDTNGVWFNDSEDIANLIVAHFEQVSRTTNPIFTDITFDIIPTIITTQDNSFLTRVPNSYEIHQTIKQMNAWSSPGLDGFQAGFYQSNWDVVGKDIIDAIQCFFEFGNMPKEFNKTYLSLIPKTDNAMCHVDFRPIGLCNTVYKIISKIIADRIKPHLKHLISPYQTSFVPGGDIHDNIIVAHEMIHTMKHKEGYSGTMALKLDLSKAFDRIEWSFLLRFLRQFGFDENFCGVKAAKNAPGITHLIFADDILIFTKADMHNIHGIMDVLEYFGSVSGQMLNLDKSSVYFSHNINPSTREILARELKMTEMTDTDKYLDVTLLIGRNKTKAFRLIVQSFGTRLKTWKGKTMNHSARTTMVKHVLNALPTYQMGCFRIPKTMIDQMDSIQKHFWWGHSDNRGLCLIGWNKLNVPKPLGGLGFRNLEQFNNALLTKLAWKSCTDDDSLCMHIVRANNGKNGRDWNIQLVSSIFDEETYNAILNRRGKFSVKSAYNSLCASHVNNAIIGDHTPKVVWKKLLHTKVPHRVQLFIWKCLRDIVHVRSKLVVYKYEIDSHCSLCNHGTETINHLLVECTYARSLWNALNVDISVITQNFTSLQDWVISWYYTDETEVNNFAYTTDSYVVRLMCTVWYIWKDRCRWIFQGIKPNIHSIIIRIHILIKQCDLANASSSVNRNRYILPKGRALAIKGYNLEEEMEAEVSGTF
ncbi:uncharacterized protein LOC113274477 [Papaver somniferum]|uniref:uncharacterized protein LOC113274477 n=1 Tax=Papaver somniferum TaxID=3469 RepID=UPI000E6F59DB|nr:uncharacterized protein LOC113274477 [Papaver somniferum]